MLFHFALGWVLYNSYSNAYLEWNSQTSKKLLTLLSNHPIRFLSSLHPKNMHFALSNIILNPIKFKIPMRRVALINSTPYPSVHPIQINEQLYEPKFFICRPPVLFRF